MSVCVYDFSMQCVTFPRITELNPHLLCVLCGGYYIDATAIIECLHSFCKSCIVRYLETHRYCPICDVLVHKTEPLQNIRPDHIRQSIVYKLVPDLYKREMCNRRNFYVHVQPQLRPQNKELKGEITEESKFFSSDDIINLSLEYMNPLGEDEYYFMASSGIKRYLRCPASVSIKNLRKLIAAKYALGLNHEIRFFFEGNQLPEHFKLLDVAYISSWKRVGYIRILFEILIIGREIVTVEKEEPLPTPSSISSNDLTKVSQPVDIRNACTINKDISVSRTVVHVTEPLLLAKPDKSDLSTSTVEEPKSALNVVKTEILSLINVPVSLTNVPATTSLRASAVNTTSVSVVKAPIVASSVSNSVVCKGSSTVQETKAKQLAIPSFHKKAVICNAKNTEVKTASPSNKPVNVKFVEGKPNGKTESSLKSKRVHESGNVASVVPVKLRTILEKSKTVLEKPKEVCPVPTKLAKLTNGIDVSTPNNVKDVPPKVLSTLTKASPSTNNVTPTSSTVSVSYPSSNSNTNPVKSSSSSNVTPCIVGQRIEIKLQRDSPRPIFSRSDQSPIIRTTTKTSKLMTRPWTTVTSSSPVTPKPSVESKEKREPTKIVKTRNTPRFLGNPSSGIRPMYQIIAQSVNSKNDGVKKFTKNISVLKVDPKTLSPISTTSSTAETPPTPTPSVSKKPFSYTPSMPKSFPSPNIFIPRSEALHFPSSMIPAKLPPYMYPYHCEPGSLQQINQLMQRMYSNFNVSPEDMAKNLDLLKTKASTSGMYGSPAYNTSLLMPFFTPALKQPKPEKNQTKMPTKLFPPAVQRIPPSNNNTTKAAANEQSAEKKPPSEVKQDAVANGQNKTNTCKKNTEISNFSINNLIPLDEVKPVSHTCNADGVNQLCDQVPVADSKNTNTIDGDTNANGTEKKDFQANNS